MACIQWLFEGGRGHRSQQRVAWSSCRLQRQTCSQRLCWVRHEERPNLWREPCNPRNTGDFLFVSLHVLYNNFLMPLQMAPTASDFTEQDELNEKPAAPADAPAAEE